MKRSGNIGLQIAVLAVFLFTTGQWMWAGGIIDHYQKLLERQTTDMEPPIETSAVKTFIEKAYGDNAVEFAVYAAMHELEPHAPFWDGGIPPEVEKKLEDEINTVIQNSYHGTLGSGAGCTIENNGDVEVTVDQYSNGRAFVSTQYGSFQVVCEREGPEKTTSRVTISFDPPGQIEAMSDTMEDFYGSEPLCTTGSCMTSSACSSNGGAEVDTCRAGTEVCCEIPDCDTGYTCTASGSCVTNNESGTCNLDGGVGVCCGS